MTARRRTLREREEAARATTAPTPASNAGTDPAPHEVQRLGTYWRRTTFTAAKSAYLADLDTQPHSPGSFAGWIDRALRDHAALTAEQRQTLTRSLGPEDQDAGVSRSFLLPTATVRAVEAAIVADRTETGTITTRTAFVSHAARAATTAAQRRYPGDTLPAAPTRLPNRPPR